MRFTVNRAFMMAIASVSLAFAAGLALMPQGKTQTYPINNPTYIPGAILASQNITTAGALTYQSNGVGTLYVRVLGTYTGLVATVQITESRAASPTWTSVTVEEVGAARKGTISANGLYRVNVAGAAQVRFNASAISTGTAAVSFSGGPGPQFVTQLQSQRPTYSASVTGLVTVASATDFFTLTGATGITTRITFAQCSGISTTVGTADIVALKRSTANTVGTSTAPTVVPHDANSAAGSSTVLAYTANPTTGTLVGNIRAKKLGLQLATTGLIPDVTTWDFGTRPGTQEVVLRAATQVFALNGAGTTLAAGAALDCSVEWTESD